MDFVRERRMWEERLRRRAPPNAGEVMVDGEGDAEMEQHDGELDGIG